MKCVLALLGLLLCSAVVTKADVLRGAAGAAHNGQGKPHRPRPTAVSSNNSSDGIVYCYWGTWSVNRPGLGAFGASNIPSGLCSHVVYAFLGLDAEGNITYDAETSVGNYSNYFSDLLPLQDNNTKLLFAVGGWNEGSDDFSTVSNNDTLRATFVSNLVNFTLTNKYNGVNIDWEYPAQRGGNESDYEAFIWLLRDLSEALHAEDLSLSVAVGVTASAIATSYNITEVNKYADHIVLMAYDFHGSWETVTGVSAPLYPQLTDATGDVLNVNASVYNWLDGGATPSKLLLGVGAYGRTFTLTSLDDVSTGASASGAGAVGVYSAEAGFFTYYEICLNQTALDWNITEVTGNYAYGNYELFWAGYDSANTMYAKGVYAADLGLGGVSMWAIDYDDFSGLCGNVTFPITKSAKNGFNGV